MNRVTVAAAITLLATCAQAEFSTGNTLLARLKGSNLDQIQAMGYITGVYDATRGLVHCSPEGVTVGQISDMVRIHLESVPETRHYSGDNHVAFVLKKAWPCANRQPPGRSS